MDEPVKPYNWSDIFLAVLPNVIWIAARLVIAASPDLWKSGWAGEAIALVASLGVIVVALLREKKLTLWALPSMGIGFQCIWVLSDALLRSGLPGQMTQPYPDWYVTGRAVLGIGMGILAGGLIGTAVWSARRWGGAAALVGSSVLGTYALGIMDPTYGLLIIAPQTYSPLGVALLDTIPQALFLVLLPAVVLRAETRDARIARLLGAFALALASTVPILTLHAFASQSVLGARPLLVELGYTLALGPLVAGVFWVILAGLTWLCSRMQRDDSGAKPGGALQSRGAAA